MEKKQLSLIWLLLLPVLIGSTLAINSFVGNFKAKPTPSKTVQNNPNKNAQKKTSTALLSKNHKAEETAQSVEEDTPANTKKDGNQSSGLKSNKERAAQKNVTKQPIKPKQSSKKPTEPKFYKKKPANQKQNPQNLAPDSNNSPQKQVIQEEKSQENEEQIETIEVTLTIDTGQSTKIYPAVIDIDSTVLDLLTTASNKYNFSITYTNYSYGAYIKELAGVSENKAQSMYWLYYINGKKANLGASSQKVKEGDKILWKYEKAN